ncbi:hypothetical protein D3C85_646040 [compost metagenome]
MALVGALVAVFSFACWAGVDRSGHRWVYRNPHDRTCSNPGCGRHEVEYCRDYQRACPSWWEAHSEGSGEKCNHKEVGTDA